jgi:tripartite-type tricarboxylate transporter receptor subunit TctC
VAAALAGAPLAAFAQNLPAKPIQLFVPFPPGGVTDLLARTLAQELGRALDQSVIVVNKPGASGMIAAEAVKLAPADGSVLMIGHIGTHAVNPHLFKRLTYDPVSDFAPISLIASTPVMLLVNANVQAKSVPELVALANARPGRLTYASFGAGSSSHLYAEIFRHEAKIDLLHVPYKGPAPAMQDLIGGQVDMMFDTVASATPQLTQGHVRALAVASRQRVPQALEVPTFAELGLPALDGGPWFGLYAPRAVPDTVRMRLEVETRKVLSSDQIAGMLKAQGIVVINGGASELAEHQRREFERWGALVKQMDIRLE